MAFQGIPVTQAMAVIYMVSFAMTGLLKWLDRFVRRRGTMVPELGLEPDDMLATLTPLSSLIVWFPALFPSIGPKVGLPADAPMVYFSALVFYSVRWGVFAGLLVVICLITSAVAFLLPPALAS